MGSLLDEEEFTRWMRQAEHTLKSAGDDMANGSYDWSCFKAQQAAEFALKAVLRGFGEEAHGHSLKDLVESLEQLSIDVPKDIKLGAIELTRHYIQARYADAYPAGSPFEFYHEAKAKEALELATQIVELARKVFADVQHPETPPPEAGGTN